MADDTHPLVTTHPFGKGQGVYLASFRHGEPNNRTLMNLILSAAGEDIHQNYLTDNPYTECCYYPADKKLVVINNSDAEQTTTVKTEAGDKTFTIAGFDAVIVTL